MATCSAQDLFSLSGEFANTTPFQLQTLQASLLCQILQASNPMADCSVSSLMSSSSCFNCLTPFQVAVIQTQLLCEILQAGGGGGQSCLTCSTSDPVADPNCTCAIHYRTDTSAFWYWDDVPAVWVPFIV